MRKPIYINFLYIIISVICGTLAGIVLEKLNCPLYLTFGVVSTVTSVVEKILLILKKGDDL